MKVLALDFDGVVSDSAAECYVVALRTYGALYRVSRLRRDAEALRRPETLTRAALQQLPHYRAFLELMPLGNRAEDFGVILDVLERGAKVRDQAEYDDHHRRWSAEDRDRYHARFYAERADLRDESPAAWEALMGPYPSFVELLLERGHEVELAVATAKDRESVRRLLERYGLAGRIEPSRLLDKDAGVSKREHLSAIQSRTGARWSEITFVDDKVNHLDAVAPLGVRCVLACWGYNGPREYQLARERGYTTCALGDASHILFGSASRKSA